MRVFSHTCSNTEIVCALGAADCLVGVDQDSDYPPDVVAALPKPGRDLDLDVGAVIALKPDLVLSSLTVPGHERIVAELQAAGLRTVVIDPLSLEDVYRNIAQIAALLNLDDRGAALVSQMRAAMPRVQLSASPPRVLVEWWPKPVIGPARLSWVSDLIELAGGCNPWAAIDAKSLTVTDEDASVQAPQAIVMSWCGVREENYRPDIVLRRERWQQVPAVRDQRVYAVTEAWLGRPGPRLVEGYRALRRIVESLES